MKYEDQIDELSKEEAVLEEKITKKSSPKADFETALNDVFAILKNPYEYWANGELDDKLLVLKVVFEDKLFYDLNEGFETARYSLPLRVFEQVVDTKSNHVDTVGKTLNQLKDYLGRFWEFYQSSPTLQKALTNS